MGNFLKNGKDPCREDEKKKECDFDWTEDKDYNEVPKDEDKNEVFEYKTGNEVSSDESPRVKIYSPRVMFEVPKDEDKNEVPKYKILSPRTYFLTDILFVDEEGCVNEVGWLLLQNLKEAKVQKEAKEEQQQHGKHVR